MRQLLFSILVVIGGLLCMRDLTHTQTIDDLMHLAGMVMLVIAGVVLGKILESL
jgi:hypothetical protein